ncbi:hypothetical protein NLX83_26380 [Allokutzneria sp. A3M-2-11 16]|uniref:hypothetical protein n=1 Tax=Allokutzneria sp. A3M-2-11 16 TaxID=2962043 RepID=UPI0020B8259C|nr:hypothetical protein [Allokutzneria sp. A3M-2-11 16]MCP3802807.1 hypothetical protein [Allokutzneria sp. A3M-2-11 16]
MTEQIHPDRVRHALRSVRAAAYSVEVTSAGTTLALVMSASPAGRRNAAEKIVGLLDAAGLRLATDDPVGELTNERHGFLVASVGSA